MVRFWGPPERLLGSTWPLLESTRALLGSTSALLGSTWPLLGRPNGDQKQDTIVSCFWPRPKPEKKYPNMVHIGTFKDNTLIFGHVDNRA